VILDVIVAPIIIIIIAKVAFLHIIKCINGILAILIALLETMLLLEDIMANILLPLLIDIVVLAIVIVDFVSLIITIATCAEIWLF
jgi:hypothetical protein